MNFKTTSILFGLLICTLWVFGLALELQKGALDEGLIFPTLREVKTSEVEAVDLTRDGKKFQLAKTATGWTMKQDDLPEVMRLDETRIKNLIDEVLRARKNEEADIPRDPSRFMDKPSEVTLKIAGGKSCTLYVGKASADGANIFVKSSDRPDPILPVKKSNLDTLFVKNIHDLRSRRLLEVNDDNGRMIELIQGGQKGKTVQVVRGDDSIWRIKQPPYGIADFEGAPSEKNRPGVRGLLNAAGGISVEKVEDFEPLGNRKMEDLGLTPAKAAYQIKVRRTGKEGKDTVTETLLIGDKLPAREEKKDVKKEDKKEDKESQDKEKENKDQYYARLESDNYAVRVSGKSLETIFEVLKDPGILRSRDLTLVEATTPDAVDIKLGKGLKELIKLRKVDPTRWQLATAAGVFKANQAAIDATGALIDTVRGKGQVKEFFDASNEEEAKKLDAKLGLDAPEAEIALYINAVDKTAKKKPEEKKEEKTDDKKTEDKKTDDKKTDAQKTEAPKEDKKTEDKKTDAQKTDKEEPKKTDKEEAKKDDKSKQPVEEEAQLKKDAKPAVVIQFGRIDRNLVYVKRINEDKTVDRLSVPVTIFDKVAPANGELAFLDDKLPSLPTSDAVKVELARGSEKLVVEKQKKNKDDKELTWQFIEPKDSPIAPDSGQITDVVDRLSQLSITKWVKRLTPKEDLDKYGLKKPAATVVVTTKKKPEDKGETTTFTLSREFEENKEKIVYGLRSGTELIFQVKPEVLKAVQEAELRDRTIFKFEADKVREINLVGWKESAKFIVNLTLKRTSEKASWIAEGLTGFALDGPKTTRFVGDMAGLKAEKFVQFSGNPLPEHKLTDADASLKITFKLEGGMTPSTLTIGALNNDKTGYFAQSSTLPRVVFLLSKTTWEPLVASYNYFAPEQKAGGK